LTWHCLYILGQIPTIIRKIKTQTHSSQVGSLLWGFICLYSSNLRAISSKPWQWGLISWFISIWVLSVIKGSILRVSLNVLQVFSYFKTLVVVAVLAIKLLGVEITVEGRVFGVLERVLREIQQLWLSLVVAPVLVLGKGLGEQGGVGQIASIGVVED